MKKVAIGGGQGFWGDSPDAAIHMIRNADIQYMGCDYLAELTLSIMAKQQLKDPTKGFAPDFTTRILKEAGKEAWDKHIKICTNAGGMNINGCVDGIRQWAEGNSMSGYKIGYVTGDNIKDTEGKVLSCTNYGKICGDVNVGGIAGSQTGYVEGCVNYGTVNARKEGGGIVGQMEPSSVLQYNQDTLQELQGELDTLSALMNKATNDASASSSELTSQLNDLTGRVDSAREAVDTLIDKTVNGFDIGTQTINITDLTKLTGQGTINGSGNGSANGSGNGNINGTIEPVPTPEPTEEPEEPPEPTETPAVTQAPAVTEAPTAAPDPDPTAAPAPEPDQSDDQPAEQSEDDREGEAHGRPRRNEPTFDVDLDFGGAIW